MESFEGFAGACRGVGYFAVALPQRLLEGGIEVVGGSKCCSASGSGAYANLAIQGMDREQVVIDRRSCSNIYNE